MSFWTKIKAVIAMFGVGGEITVIATEQSMGWHGITIGATIMGVLITQFIQDNNNNNIPDLFEK